MKPDYNPKKTEQTGNSLDLTLEILNNEISFKENITDDAILNMRIDLGDNNTDVFEFLESKSCGQKVPMLNSGYFAYLRKRQETKNYK